MLKTRNMRMESMCKKTRLDEFEAFGIVSAKDKRLITFLPPVGFRAEVTDGRTKFDFFLMRNLKRHLIVRTRDFDAMAFHIFLIFTAVLCSAFAIQSLQTKYD
jgi:hypothetical protein